MGILGHSQIGVPMNTYTHIPQELIRDAAGHMDVYLRDLTGDDQDTATERAS